MSDQDFSVEKTKLEEKLAKARGERKAREFVAELEHMDKEGLEKRFLEYAKTEQGIINTRKADEDLQKKVDAVNEARRGYTEQLTANKDLRRLVSLIISEKFGDELMDLKVSMEDADENEDDSGVEEL